MAINYYTKATAAAANTTGTGFDQFIDALRNDVRLTGAISEQRLEAGVAAAEGMLSILAEAANATGAADNGSFTATDLIGMNAWIRENHGAQFDQLKEEFGEIRGIGASATYRGRNLLDTIMGRDIFSIGQELNTSDARFAKLMNEKADYFSEFWTDVSTTNTGLDRITDTVLGEFGLRKRISAEERIEGAKAADGINKLILEAAEATGAMADGTISADDVRAINSYIREHHLDTFTALHGNDQGRVETGFHKVQGDGGRLQMFGEKVTDTIADGIYHIGFEIDGDNFLNEDGAANASVEQVAEWLTYFMVDQGRTGTGLDKLVQVAQSDIGLTSQTSAASIVEGLQAANGLNELLVEAIEIQGLARDGMLDAADVKAMSDYIRANHMDRFLELRGESGVSETGFEAINGNGATQLNDAKRIGCINWTGDNFVDTIMSGLYSIGFEMSGENFVNPSEWMKVGTDATGTYDSVIKAAFGAHEMQGSEGGDRLVSYSDGGEPGVAATNAALTDDTLTGGTGADSFEFHLLMNAKEAIIKKHTNDAGEVNWMKVMKENANVHDHWVEGIGNDVITDFTKAEGDKIVVRGHTVAIQSIEYGVDEQGEFSLVSLYSNQMKGGAHHNDALGSIKVYGDKVTAEDIQLDGAMMIMDGMDIVSEEFGGGVGPWGVLEANNVNNIASWLNEFYLANSIKIGTDSRDRMKGSDIDDIIRGNGGNDQLNGKAGDDYIDGGTGADRLVGEAGNDTLFGGTGNDNLIGGAGADVLIDGDGRDKVQGNAGDDVFLSHADGDRDVFNGGAGADTFMFWVDGKMSMDTIKGFRSAQGDKIVLGGEVETFSIAKGKRGASDIRLFDADGNSLGTIRTWGATEADIEINSEAFLDYQSEMLLSGVDVEAELGALCLDCEPIPVAEENDFVGHVGELVTGASPIELDMAEVNFSVAMF